MKFFMLKLLGIPILVLFLNLGFVLVAKEAISQLSVIVPLLIVNFIIILDILVRPLSKKKDKFNRYISIATFLLMPFIIIFPYYEHTFLVTVQMFPPPLFYWLSLLGVIILILGGIILLLSRLQLGRYGGSRIVIEDEHQLITSGVYRYIRHPMYLSFLLIFFGYFTALGSVFMTIIIVLGFFFIFKLRMELEERLLFLQFGEKYKKYMKRTKRIFPFLY